MINETRELDSVELAWKVHDDALYNPFIGWCKDCDKKPEPHIVRLEEGLERKWGKIR